VTRIAFLLYGPMTALDAVGARGRRATSQRILHDPQPPYDPGSYETADEETRDRATRYFVPAASA